MLEKELKLIESYFDIIEAKNNKISKANVGWHLDHTLKVINTVCKTLVNSDPKEYKYSFNRLRLIVFTLGFFPRGKAKSPKRVLPPEVIYIEELQKQLSEVTENVKNLEGLTKNKHFHHPLFKQLNKKKAIRFMKMHTNHHLKIVKDIIK
ncbi:DUF1569 domain-containing protein [uncultured Polaribacter sp.]|uniref:DUF1569 domain-containing protein n=1 Tax=uncultured Polaribacter sp. TaxID=174711 RepID=UPI00261A43EB|nr:DUF1569 domain-containing protein [uncultured Polaribacter sp.]